MTDIHEIFKLTKIFKTNGLEIINDIDEKITDELIISEDAYNAYKTDNRILAYEIITVPNPFESFQTYTLPTPFFIPKGCYLTADHRYSNSAKDSNLNLRNNYILNGYQA